MSHADNILQKLYGMSFQGIIFCDIPRPILENFSDIGIKVREPWNINSKLDNKT